MEWIQTLTIIASFLGMFIYMLKRQDRTTDLISQNAQRISMIEGFLWSQLNKKIDNKQEN